MIAFSLLLSLAIAQAPAPKPAQAAPLTIMSFNIRMGIANDGEDHWTKRREQLFALLREQRADVVGLQEAMHFQLEEIVRAVPGYDWVGVGRTDGRQAGEYAAILYRTARLPLRRTDTFWFSDTPAVVVDVVGQPDRAHLHLGVLRGPRGAGLLRRTTCTSTTSRSRRASGARCC